MAVGAEKTLRNGERKLLEGNPHELPQTDPVGSSKNHYGDEVTLNRAPSLRFSFENHHSGAAPAGDLSGS